MTKKIDAQTLKSAIHDVVSQPGAGKELSLLDVREEGQFGLGHLLHAVPLPYSVLESRLDTLVPRRSAPVVLVDAGDGVAARAADRMAACGYTDVAVLDGGVEAWRAAGCVVFEGVNVPSKAFGEVVEHQAHTPAIEPQELHAMQARGDKLVVVDGRTPEEFRRMSIPGGISVPNAELVYRIPDIAPDPDTTIVVNCAGRTRSIIGAQTLINAGLPNRVVALRGGTMGWRLAGFELNHGRTDRYPDSTPQGMEKARAYAADVTRRFGVRSVDRATLKGWQADRGRTLYLLDVRGEDEYEAGHMPGSVHAPGGQLVQATDQWCGTRGARIVLLDDAAGVRAVMTAHWLLQLGWDVHVLAGGLDNGLATETGRPARVTLGLDQMYLETMPPRELDAAMKAGGVAVVDADVSGLYREGHIPGAVWGVRPRADRLLAACGDAAKIVLYSEHEMRARLLAIDLTQLTDRPIVLLAGGREAWRAAGLPLEASPGNPPDAERIDFLFWVHDRHLGNDQAARDYLAWEEQLPAQIAADGDSGYRIGSR